MLMHAVFIGINYYGTENQLAGCIPDINNMYNRYKSKLSTVIALHDGKQDEFPLHATMPTADNIRDALRKIIAVAKAGDMVLVHYSGHGSQLQDENGDEADGQDECICPVDFDFNKKDAGFIRDDELRSILGYRKDIKVRIIFDCCHSGSGIDLPYRWSALKSCDTDSKPLVADIMFISGCRDNQTSADATIDDLPSGALTYALLKSLATVDKAKKKKPTVKYTWKDLIELVRLRLKRDGYDQVPQLCMCNKLDLTKVMDL